MLISLLPHQPAEVVKILRVLNCPLETRQLVKASLTYAQIAVEVIVDLQAQYYRGQLADVASVFVGPDVPAHEFVVDGASHVKYWQGPAVTTVLGRASGAYGPGGRHLLAFVALPALYELGENIHSDFQRVALLTPELPLLGLLLLLLGADPLAVPVMLQKVPHGDEDLAAAGVEGAAEPVGESGHRLDEEGAGGAALGAPVLAASGVDHALVAEQLLAGPATQHRDRPAHADHALELGQHFRVQDVLDGVERRHMPLRLHYYYNQFLYSWVGYGNITPILGTVGLIDSTEGLMSTIVKGCEIYYIENIQPFILNNSNIL